MVAIPYLYFYWDEIDVSPSLPMVARDVEEGDSGSASASGSLSGSPNGRGLAEKTR